ncbi:cation diffusion facilitator family transporter [Spirulina sp. CS-785/01]|uniref:cation diffusion facilitator family transporter n=1 Tax=Spirulina sp. CS-785/01 TaxID=3021716 RepID=UPI00232AD9F3|nr:cation diffusion facilitator family transporter [Spirulina sp. CS-785/01]MDB9312147.1 cation diffusion facilitator family transporter [Spirulina sp. CS-785/01]
MAACWLKDCQTCISPLKGRLLPVALLLVGSFAGVEWLVGKWSRSLALQADSGHLFLDGAAIALALLAMGVSRHPRLRQHPVEVWAAMANGGSLLVMGGLIAWEAIRHFFHPPTAIVSLPMLMTAIVALGVNGVNIALLHRDYRDDINIRGVFLHAVTDALSSLGVIIAAIVISLWHWQWVDAAISLGVAGLMGVSAVRLLHQSYQQLKVTSPPLDNTGFWEVGTTDLAQIIHRG